MIVDVGVSLSRKLRMLVRWGRRGNQATGADLLKGYWTKTPARYFLLPGGVLGWYQQALNGSFSAVSKTIFASKSY